MGQVLTLLIFVSTVTFQTSAGAAESCSPSPEQNQLLQEINDARSQARSCGNSHYPAVSPVAWNCQLAAAAEQHSRNMARSQSLTHHSSSGQSPGERASAAGYAWRNIGENIAAGQQTPEAVVHSWLTSPSHCAILMRGTFRDAGGAVFRTEGSNYGTYWTLMLGTQQSWNTGE